MFIRREYHYIFWSLSNLLFLSWPYPDVAVQLGFGVAACLVTEFTPTFVGRSLSQQMLEFRDELAIESCQLINHGAWGVNQEKELAFIANGRDTTTKKHPREC